MDNEVEVSLLEREVQQLKVEMKKDLLAGLKVMRTARRLPQTTTVSSEFSAALITPLQVFPHTIPEGIAASASSSRCESK